MKLMPMKWISTKQSKFGLLLAGSIVCGILAAFAAQGYLKQELAAEKAKLNPAQQLVDVIVAKQDLPKGAVVGPDTMAIRQIPKEFAASVAVRPENFDGYLGAKLAVPIRSGESLLMSSTEGTDITTFSSKLKPGIRAITVSVDEVTSVSGMLQPRDHIDLLWSVKPSNLKLGDANAPEQTVIFMQDVKVLATGKQVRPGADESRPRGYTTVTLEATAQQAQQLVVAQRSGKLTALLRNPDDVAPLGGKSVDLAHLLNLQTAAVASRPSTEVIVGGRGDITKQRIAISAGTTGEKHE